MRLRDWKDQRVRLWFPGHPEHNETGRVLSAIRATAMYRQRAFVLWDNGHAGYVPVDVLRVI
jgi:hypothetical protein